MSSFTSIISSPTSISLSITSTSDCITATPGKNGYVPPEACNAEWSYSPSFAAAVLFTVLFGLTTLTQLCQAIYYKKLRLCWPLLMGATWETGGFAFRVVGSKNQQTSIFSFMAQFLVLLAPMWVNAFVYMVLGRMIYFFVPQKEVWGIKSIKIAKIFVWLDILSFLVQATGGSMLSSDSDSQKLGIDIYMGGIGAQQLFILLFTFIAIKFYIIMRDIERIGSILPTPKNAWRPLLYALFGMLIAITIRVVFRLVEFSSGTDPDKNPIPFHEAYFYALDGLPLFFACILMNIFHPGRTLRGEGSEFPRLTRKEKKLAKQVRKQAKQTAKDERKAEKKGRKGQKNHRPASNDEFLLQPV